MAGVFISYRRSDSQAWADRLADSLTLRFGGGLIWRDVDDIPAGEPWPTAIRKALAAADAVLVLGRRTAYDANPHFAINAIKRASPRSASHFGSAGTKSKCTSPVWSARSSHSNAAARSPRPTCTRAIA
jgi:hypothetical protein